jgi:hypothetical protein
MFNIGDEAYITAANDFSNRGVIKIQKYKVIEKLTPTKLRLDSKPPMVVNDWAVGATAEEATKIGMTFLINKLELNRDINTFTMKDYEHLEANHSELIFKYMEKVVEDY